MIQNRYAYGFCDISIGQKYHTEWTCNITLNAEIEYKRNIDLFYSLNAYIMRVMVQSEFINIGRNVIALFNQIKTNLNKCYRIPKRKSNVRN
jgi:hypothetical protein